MRRLAILAVLAACGSDDVDGMMNPNVDGGGSGSNDLDGGVEIDAPDAPPGNEDLDAVPTACTTTRSTTDRPDDSPLDQIRVLYVIPSDGVDDAYDTSGKICNSIRGIATWFHTQSNVYLRWDTNGGDLDIGFVRLSKTDAQMRGTDNAANENTGIAYVRNRIENDLIAKGMIKSNKLYAVYYGGTSLYACGGGAYPPLIEARVGAMYLKAVPTGLSTECEDALPWGQSSLKPNYIDYGMLHEVVHSMGVVADNAPNEIGMGNPGHVYDLGATTPQRDLMYSPRPSMADPGWATNDPNGLLLDINRNDYFDAGPSVTVEMTELSILAPLPPNAQRIVGW